VAPCGARSLRIRRQTARRVKDPDARPVRLPQRIEATLVVVECFAVRGRIVPAALLGDRKAVAGRASVEDGHAFETRAERSARNGAGRGVAAADDARRKTDFGDHVPAEIELEETVGDAVRGVAFTGDPDRFIGGDGNALRIVAAGADSARCDRQAARDDGWRLGHVDAEDVAL
jgi:hypothetical protein